MTASQGIIITSNDQLHKNFHLLDSSSTVCFRIRLLPGEDHILLDLSERNVTLIPSATSQLCSRSKVHQARVLSEFMLPHTTVVYDSHQLLKATTTYRSRGIKEVIVKLDRKNAGMGVLFFKDIEDVYNQTLLANAEFPLVVQPYLKSFKDIRVLILGDYIEAYHRFNPNNFRHNLHCGGTSTAWKADDQMIDFCKRIMKRGDFAYAHIDLMVTPDNTLYLTEINLRGGLKGAAIDSATYDEKISQIHKELLNNRPGQP